MSQPDVVRGTYISIMVEDPDNPGTWIAICGLTTRDFTHQGQTKDVFTRDCADPEGVPVRRLIITGEQWDLSGQGSLNRSQLELLNGLMNVISPYRFVLDEPADDEVFGGYYAGNAAITQKKITGSDDDMTSCELTIQSDGAWAFTEV